MTSTRREIEAGFGGFKMKRPTVLQCDSNLAEWLGASYMPKADFGKLAYSGHFIVCTGSELGGIETMLLWRIEWTETQS